jgi:hypothetical protein
MPAFLFFSVIYVGNYSVFVEQEIKIVKKMPDSFKNELVEDGEVHFYKWDGLKLEGYWYAETVEALEAIAEFIEGYAEFIYENDYKFRIVFKDGIVYLQYCREVWDTSLNVLSESD